MEMDIQFRNHRNFRLKNKCELSKAKYVHGKPVSVFSDELQQTIHDAGTSSSDANGNIVQTSKPKNVEKEDEHSRVMNIISKVRVEHKWVFKRFNRDALRTVVECAISPVIFLQIKKNQWTHPSSNTNNTVT